MQINIPIHIVRALNLLNSNGYKAYIVGGCVRDCLLNKVPNDWDICTSSLPEQTIEVFKEYKTVLTGAKHGTVCVIIDSFPIEITTFRIDGKYADNRHPESIKFSQSLSEDLVRRDFTINAMAYSQSEGIIDLSDGISDLNNKIIRCVGLPEKRFEEDALRIMRAIRFSAQLGFEIEADTKNAIFAKSDLLLSISAERITDEFIKLISSNGYIKTLKEYEDVIKLFLPYFNASFDDVEITNDIRLRLAYILSTSCCPYDDVFGILKLPKILKNQVKTILEHKDIKVSADKYEIKKLLSTLGSDILSLILDFKSYNGEDVLLPVNVMSQIIAKNECYCIKQLDITGTDIKSAINCDLNIGKTLEYLLRQVISERLPNNHEILLDEAEKYINKNKL